MVPVQMGDKIETAQESAPSPTERAGFKQKIAALDGRFEIFKLAKFAIATGTGFLIAEAVLTLGLFRLYGRFTAPSDAYSSPTFLLVDVTALALGVAASFFLNERFTLKKVNDDDNNRTPGGASSRIHIRLLKFEAVNAMGNVMIILVQLAMLFTLSVTPVVGNIIGAIVSYPVTYFVSMHFVWGPAPGPSIGQQRLRKSGGSHGKRTARFSYNSPMAEALVFVALYLISHAQPRKRR